MNGVNLIGRLTKDPELRITTSGISACRFTVAVNRKYKNDKGEYEADFISCIAWRQTAEFISKYFYKGQMIALEGTLRTGSYQDKTHPDVTHYTTDVYVDNAEFCGSKAENGGGGNYTAAPAPAAQTTAQAAVRTAQAASVSTQAVNDYEEILGGGDVPF